MLKRKLRNGPNQKVPLLLIDISLQLAINVLKIVTSIVYIFMNKLILNRIMPKCCHVILREWPIPSDQFRLGDLR